MTQDEIIRMAREADAHPRHSSTYEQVVWEFFTGELERFAALVAAHEREKLHNEIATLQCDIEEMYSRADVDYMIGVEREACEKVCEPERTEVPRHILEQIAAAIRSRNNAN